MTDFKNVYLIENTEIHLIAPPCSAIMVGMYCHLLLNYVITQAQTCFSLQEKAATLPSKSVLSSSSPQHSQGSQG